MISCGAPERACARGMSGPHGLPIVVEVAVRRSDAALDLAAAAAPHVQLRRAKSKGGEGGGILVRRIEGLGLEWRRDGQGLNINIE